MTMQREPTAPLRPAEPAAGFEVFTVDGMPVGTVSAIDDGFMRINAPLRPDFWLRTDDAASVEGRAITLAYPREALEQHKHPGPAPSSEDIMPAGVDPVLLDEEEQLAQRELMERELEEQRRHLAERAPEAPAREEWQEEQRAGAKIAGIAVAAVAAMAGIVTILCAARMLRRRRRHHEAASEPPTP